MVEVKKTLLEIPEYLADVALVAEDSLPWEKLANSSILLSGGTGLIGSFLVDVLMWKNLHQDFKCSIFILGRNQKRAEERFGKYYGNNFFHFISHDINFPLKDDEVPAVLDNIIHLASNTHPVAYAMEPIRTITANILGTKNLLDFAVTHKAKRFAFASSNEIYGENRGDTEFFDEQYCGYIDCNSLRAGYPESKRCGEALCQAYRKEYDLDVVIPRLTRSYGPTLLSSDTKALSQFLHKAIAGEDIVLKSAGTQYYSYTYVADAVAGLLTVLLKGNSGEAYNIADEASDIMLKDLAALIAETVGRKVIFEIPDAVEAAGFSKATKARLCNTKIASLGWRSFFDIESGIIRTISILKRIF